VIAACDCCLRRSYLVGHLAPRIASLLDRGRRNRRAPGLLALEERQLIAAVAGSGSAEAERFLDHFEPRAALEGLAAADVRAVCRHSPSYPSGLFDLTDLPAVVFFRGEESALARLADRPAVALVGARRASPYGLEMSHALGRALGAAGLAVVSGLALGVDAAAHRGCLEAGGLPIAVLAGGPDLPYPRRHRALYEQVRQHGLVLSELPAGQRAFRWSFPARNRLMAGLAAMTVVVEAAQPSGSLITAEFAEDLGRAVGAVPGRATSRLAAGSNGLLADGAKLVAGPGDVLDELYGVGAAPCATTAAAEPDPLEALEPVQRRVLDAVEESQERGAIGRAAELRPGQVRAALASLEALGLVRRSGLGEYERVARFSSYGSGTMPSP
jgi:DNA processing protein